LHLGAGAGSLARFWDAERPGSRQLAIDIDAALLRLVRERFDLPRAPRLRLRAGDAGDAVASARPDWYDVVVRDVFAGDETPPHVRTREFAGQVARTLRPGGVFLANCAGLPSAGGARHELFRVSTPGASPLAGARRELAALADGFGADAVAAGRLALIAEPGVLKGRRFGNIVLVAVRAGPDAPDLGSPGLARALRTLPVPAHILTGAELTHLVARSV
jgi:SAM-dependent methyltransferase